MNEDIIELDWSPVVANLTMDEIDIHVGNLTITNPSGINWMTTNIKLDGKSVKATKIELTIEVNEPIQCKLTFFPDDEV